MEGKDRSTAKARRARRTHAKKYFYCFVRDFFALFAPSRLPFLFLRTWGYRRFLFSCGRGRDGVGQEVEEFLEVFAEDQDLGLADLIRLRIALAFGQHQEVVAVARLLDL